MAARMSEATSLGETDSVSQQPSTVNNPSARGEGLLCPSPTMLAY